MKKKIWQKLSVILAVLVMVTSLSACGSSSTTATTDGATLTGSAE